MPRIMDRNLALEFVRVTEAAAIAAYDWIGRGDAHAADKAAVDAMRNRFNDINFYWANCNRRGEQRRGAGIVYGRESWQGRQAAS